MEIKFDGTLKDFINKAHARFNNRVFYRTNTPITYQWKDSVPDRNALQYGFIRKVYIEEDNGDLKLVYSEPKGGFKV